MLPRGVNDTHFQIVKPDRSSSLLFEIHPCLKHFYIIGIVSLSPMYSFPLRKIGFIRVTYDPLSVLGFNIFFPDLVTLSLSLSLFLILRFECKELDFKKISYIVYDIFDNLNKSWLITSLETSWYIGTCLLIFYICR